MYRLGQVSLVYVRHTQDIDYNPVIESVSKLVKCKLMDAFSVNYYQNQTRDMRRARNIVVAKNYSFDVIQDNVSYQLEYADIGTKRYKITNILKDRKSSLQVILDCEEVMNE